MTKSFENNLPDRVKEIQQRQLELLYMPIETDESKTLKTTLTNELLSGIIIPESPEHLALKNRIEQLEDEFHLINREPHKKVTLIRYFL